MRACGQGGWITLESGSPLRGRNRIRQYSSGDHPKVVQEILGQASIKMTLDTYSHVLAQMHEDSAGRLQASLGGGVQ